MGKMKDLEIAGFPKVPHFGIDEENVLIRQPHGEGCLYVCTSGPILSDDQIEGLKSVAEVKHEIEEVYRKYWFLGYIWVPEPVHNYADPLEIGRCTWADHSMGGYIYGIDYHTAESFMFNKHPKPEEVLSHLKFLYSQLTAEVPF